MVERIFPHIVGDHSPVAPTHANGILKRRVVGRVGVGIDLNVTGNALDHLSNLQIAFVVDRMDLDPRPLLALLVGDLPNVRVQLVDRQTGTGFDVAAVLNLDRPLVAGGKL